MNSTDRFSLIRAKLNKPQPAIPPKPAGMFAADHPELKRQIRKAVTLPVYPKASVSGCMVCESGSAKERGIKWLSDFDTKPPPSLRHKRKARISPLTKISEQLPVKLKRLG